MEFLQELNEQQKQAVYEEHPRICVIAGPGCGKTKTLVSRLIYLLSSQKAQPQNILVLTFAKKAIKNGLLKPTKSYRYSIVKIKGFRRPKLVYLSQIGPILLKSYRYFTFTFNFLAVFF